MKYLVADNKVLASGSVKSCKSIYDAENTLFRRIYDKVWIQEEQEIVGSPTVIMVLQDTGGSLNFKTMADEQLYETYSVLQVALVEEGHKESIVDAFIDCSVEIATRYFESRGIIDTTSRKKLLEKLLKIEN